MTRPQSNVHLPSDLLHAIGHVAALWAQLEYIIDSTIRYGLERPGAPQIDTVLILPFRKRVELLSHLFAQFVTDEPDATHTRELIASIRSLQPQRDLVVHGSVGGSELEEPTGNRYFFRRVRWEKPARLIEKRYLTVAQVEKIASEISDQIAIAGLFEMLFWPRPSEEKSD